MTVDEMKKKKRELGYTNEKISELSGVPIGTVQKIFSGETKSPRYATICKILKVLSQTEPNYIPYALEPDDAKNMSVMESSALYEYGCSSYPSEKRKGQTQALNLAPPRKKLGIADGKFHMPPDSMLFDDEICEMFDEN